MIMNILIEKQIKSLTYSLAWSLYKFEKPKNAWNDKNVWCSDGICHILKRLTNWSLKVLHSNLADAVITSGPAEKRLVGLTYTAWSVCVGWI